MIRTLSAMSVLAIAGAAVAGGPIVGTPMAIFSSDISLANSVIPGAPGENFGDDSLWDSLVRSPDGQTWAFQAPTATGGLSDEVLIRGNGMSTMNADLLAREDRPYGPMPAALLDNLDALMGIGDNGAVAISGDLDGDSTLDDVVADLGTNSTIAQEGGDASAVFGNGVVWDLLDTAQYTTNGIGFRATSIDGLATDKDEAIVLGNTVIAQEGGAVNGSTELWDNFDGSDSRFNADGSRHIIQGDLTGNTASDDVVVVDGNIVIQEGSTIGSFASPVDFISNVRMESNGDWFAEGDNEDNQDWVVRNGQVVAATGDMIPNSGGLMYSDAEFAGTFFGQAGNNNGDYIIAGLSNADPSKDGALVFYSASNPSLDGIVLQQGDAIDLDGNGILDDDAFIDTFRNDDFFLTDDLKLYALLDWISSDGLTEGQALVVVQIIPAPGALGMLGLAGLAAARRRRA